MTSADIQPDGTFSLKLPAGKNYLGMYFGQGWRGVNTDALGEKGIDVVEGETKELEVRVKPHKAEDDQPPKPLSPEDAQQLAEKAAVAAIRALGGWTTSKKIEGQEHVVEVNMVYHEDDENGREENRLLTDESLSYVRKFPKLRGLFLTREQATDEGLANIRGMESLETLLIWDATAVTDAGAAHIATLPNLEDLHLSNSQLTDKGLSSLSKLKNIKSLSLQGNQFTDEGLVHLKNMTQLKSLCLGMNKGGITDEGVKQLAGLTNLQLLDLQNTKVTDDGLQSLVQMKQLKDLWTNTDGITPAGLKELRKQFPKLNNPDRDEP